LYLITRERLIWGKSLPRIDKRKRMLDEKFKEAYGKTKHIHIIRDSAMRKGNRLVSFSCHTFEPSIFQTLPILLLFFFVFQCLLDLK